MLRIAHLNEVTFNQPWCYNFAPHPGGRDAIADLLQDFDAQSCLVAYFFSQSRAMYGDNLKPASFEAVTPWNPADEGGGLADDPRGGLPNLDFTAKLDAGKCFAILPNGAIAAYEFKRQSPSELFDGLYRHHVYGHRYNLTPIETAVFHGGLLPEDKVKFTALACNFSPPERIELVRQSVFDWLVEKRREKAPK